MTNRTDILNELREISPLVAGIELVNVFSIPEGYFETLPEIIAGRTDKPEGSAVLEKISRQMPLDIPSGYFETLADTILAQVKEEHQVISMETGKSMPQDLPAGYFENLASNILSKIHTVEENAKTEIESLSPIVAGISRKMPQSVPGGYFESLSDIISVNAEKKEAKVISLFQRKTWIRYAAAAIVVGVVALAAMMIFKPNQNKELAGNPQQKIEQALPDEEIQQLAAISDDELKSYADASQIKSEDASLNSVNDEISLIAMTNSDNLQDILQQLPDEAIQGYSKNRSTVTTTN